MFRLLAKERQGYNTQYVCDPSKDRARNCHHFYSLRHYRIRSLLLEICKVYIEMQAV